MIRLLGLAGVLLVSAACVDLHLRLQLARDGSGRFESDVSMGPKTTELFRRGGAEVLFNQMMPPAPALDRAELKRLGIQKLAVVVDDDEGWSGHTELRFRSLSAVDSLVKRHALEAPHFSLQPVSGGTWEVRSSPAGGDSPFQGGPELPDDMFSGLQDLDQEEMMALLLGLMGEMSMFRVVVELEVPGEVVEVSPQDGVEVERGLVRWTIDLGKTAGAALQGMAGGLGKADGGPPPMPTFASEGFQVRFMPLRPMRATAAWPR